MIFHSNGLFEVIQNMKLTDDALRIVSHARGHILSGVDVRVVSARNYR